jgi:C_GCAxxG_C_C family probable redox protein
MKTVVDAENAETVRRRAKMFDSQRLKNLTAKGLCCSQAVLQMGLEDCGLDENPELIQAVAGLCGGLHSGLVCGILSGAACLLSLCIPEKENAEKLIKDLVQWFKDTYEEENGGINCENIVAGDEMNKLLKCPKILAATYEKALELLEESGYEL